MKEALTKQEWIIMETLWKQHPLFLSQIMEAMERAVDWQKSTFSTYMRKLCENGYIGYTTISGNRAYTPLADREECIRNESRHVMSKLTDKGAKMLLACMIEETGLNDKDRLELQDLITKLGSEPKREKPEAE
ncbi:MAG: BlaI/MecI/CopY family transcriptional regulator [Clostridiaceae bacterium]|nr:BlaI/MecI/CopY family transcriptional regulator [Clostridiaceae bacterium]